MVLELGSRVWRCALGNNMCCSPQQKNAMNHAVGFDTLYLGLRGSREHMGHSKLCSPASGAGSAEYSTPHRAESYKQFCAIVRVLLRRGTTNSLGQVPSSQARPYPLTTRPPHPAIKDFEPSYSALNPAWTERSLWNVLGYGSSPGCEVMVATGGSSLVRMANSHGRCSPALCVAQSNIVFNEGTGPREEEDLRNAAALGLRLVISSGRRASRCWYLDADFELVSVFQNHRIGFKTTRLYGSKECAVGGIGFGEIQQLSLPPPPSGIQLMRTKANHRVPNAKTGANIAPLPRNPKREYMPAPAAGATHHPRAQPSMR
ncbi:hypothetical protein BD779DRAFT_1474361 [Infundibulicybe gibba]|nr:hypothetical protein BD779DRAFT_1474361 [Infundibulicybe gibba]